MRAANRFKFDRDKEHALVGFRIVQKLQVVKTWRRALRSRFAQSCVLGRSAYRPASLRTGVDIGLINEAAFLRSSLGFVGVLSLRFGASPNTSKSTVPVNCTADAIVDSAGAVSASSGRYPCLSPASLRVQVPGEILAKDFLVDHGLQEVPCDSFARLPSAVVDGGAMGIGLSTFSVSANSANWPSACLPVAQRWHGKLEFSTFNRMRNLDDATRRRLAAHSDRYRSKTLGRQPVHMIAILDDRMSTPHRFFCTTMLGHQSPARLCGRSE